MGAASSHTPRRTFITRLTNKGIGAHVLAEHSISAVNQSYIDFNDTQLAQAGQFI
tara:strand:+ start:390 stop:554 length:165 start_codon:yes stop_codon:yes gene_type:complete